MDGRNHHEVAFHPEADEDHRGEKSEYPGRQLGLQPQEPGKGHHEAEDEGQGREGAPGRLGPMDDPGLFPWKLPVPDDQVLGEEEIRPKDGEGEGELSQVMELLWTHELVQVRVLALGIDRGPSGGRYPTPKSPHEEPRPEDGGEPVGFQRHGPIKSEDAHDYRIEDKADGSQTGQPLVAPNLLFLLTLPPLGQALDPTVPPLISAPSGSLFQQSQIGPEVKVRHV